MSQRVKYLSRINKNRCLYMFRRGEKRQCTCQKPTTPGIIYCNSCMKTRQQPNPNQKSYIGNQMCLYRPKGEFRYCNKLISPEELHCSSCLSQISRDHQFGFGELRLFYLRHFILDESKCYWF